MLYAYLYTYTYIYAYYITMQHLTYNGVPLLFLQLIIFFTIVLMFLLCRFLLNFISSPCSPQQGQIGSDAPSWTRINNFLSLSLFPENSNPHESSFILRFLRSSSLPFLLLLLLSSSFSKICIRRRREKKKVERGEKREEEGSSS